MIASWLLFPLVALIVLLGIGLLLEWLGGWKLDGVLLPGLGLAGLMAIASLTTLWSAIAPLTPWIVLAVAIIGLVSGRRRLRALRPDPWATCAAAVVFCVCVAPQAAVGAQTLLGYFVDTDQGFHLELASWLLAHGRSLSGVPSVSRLAVPLLLHTYLGTQYPTGVDAGLGALRPLVGENLAWIYQPYQALMMVCDVLVIYSLLRTVSPRPLRATCATFAVLSGLVYAFYLEDSIKELAMIGFIAAIALLAVDSLRGQLRPRRIAPLAVFVLAAADVYGVAAGPWIWLPLVCVVVIALRRMRAAGLHGREWPLAELACAVGLVVLFVVPAAVQASTFLHVVSTALGSATGNNGNLMTPLSHWQVFGIWPSGDFRFAPTEHLRVVYGMLWLAVASSLFAVYWIIRNRDWALGVLVLTEVVATVYELTRTSPYAATKVMALFAPTVMVMALLGAVALISRRRFWAGLGGLVGLILAVGVVWTDVLGYHGATVAPEKRLHELATINTRFAGEGPTFYNIFDPLAPYMLRDTGVAVPGAYGAAVTRPGHALPGVSQLVAPWDPNALTLSYLESFRLLVFDRFPLTSRPPADYRLVFQDGDYAVWRREAAPRVLRQIPLSYGAPVAPAPVSCSLVRRSAQGARRLGGRLAYAAWPGSASILVPAATPHPADWSAIVASGQSAPYFLFLPQTSGTITGSISVPASGRYHVWLQGALTRLLRVSIDGKPVGAISQQAGDGGQSQQIGTVDLRAGAHSVTLDRPADDLQPGNRRTGDLLGPLVLIRDAEPPAVRTVVPGRASSLCGRRLEWLEIVTR